MSSLPRPISWPPVGDVRTVLHTPLPYCHNVAWRFNNNNRKTTNPTHWAQSMGTQTISHPTWAIPAWGTFKANWSQGGLLELWSSLTMGLHSRHHIQVLRSKIIDIAKEASIYCCIGLRKRLARMLDHSREGLVLEYMKNGDLKTYLRAHNSISTSLKLKWAYQVAEAVDLLHRKGIIHCDIKPRNLLLDAFSTLRLLTSLALH